MAQGEEDRRGAQRDEGTSVEENLNVGEEALSDLPNWASVLLCLPFL